MANRWQQECSLPLLLHVVAWLKALASSWFSFPAATSCKSCTPCSHRNRWWRGSKRWLRSCQRQLRRMRSTSGGCRSVCVGCWGGLLASWRGLLMRLACKRVQLACGAGHEVRRFQHGDVNSCLTQWSHPSLTAALPHVDRMQAAAGAADPVLEAYDARLAEASGTAQQPAASAAAAVGPSADVEADPFGLDALLEQQAAAEAAAAAKKRQVGWGWWWGWAGFAALLLHSCPKSLP